MKREELGDLIVFLAVAEEQSFTRAAARLGTSQSSLSQIVRRLENRLGLRLLTRTTRSVSATEVGEALLQTLRPALRDIDTRLAALSELSEKPTGTIRITCGQHAAETALWPSVARLLRQYPKINVELTIDASLTDIVAERYDAGVRLGEQVDRDMIAMRIGPDLRMIVVAAPSYLALHPAPLTPHDLTQHSCINVRLPSSGGLYIWEFERDGHKLNVRVDGQAIFNEMRMIVTAAAQGFGLAYVMEDQARELLERGHLIEVLADWCQPFLGYHLYYPSRRQQSGAFRLLLNALRYE